MTSRPALPRIGGIVAAGILALSLAACGGDDTDEPTDTTGSTGSTSTDAPEEPAADGVLDEQTLEGALLTADDVPAGFEESESNEDETSDTGTCLDDLSNFDDREESVPENDAEIEFTATSDVGESQVSSAVESYADADEAVGAVEAFLEIAQGCTTAQGSDDEGVTYDLTLETTDDTTLDGADRQVTVAVSGTLSNEAQSFDVAFGFVVATTANNLTAVGTSDFGQVEAPIADEVETYAQAQLDRLTEVG